MLDALGLGKISVGPPYFSSVFVPLMVPLVFLMGIGPLARWKHENPLHLAMKLRYAFVASLFISIPFPAVFLGAHDWSAVAGVALAVWVLFTAMQNLYAWLCHRSLLAIPRGVYGMTFAHLGIGVTLLGIVLSSVYSVEKDVVMHPGETLELGGYAFRLENIEEVPGPNYMATRGTVQVLKEGKAVAVLHPEKRVYRVQANPMTEAAIDAGIFRDIYVALGEPLEDGAWSVRLYVKPFVRWIWMGALFMALGGILAASDRRYRILARRQREALRQGMAPSPA
ncbi:MAG: hypothetical protein D6819_00180 [Gammaproteobacteria bacterium]|nr:MAG: hypothetical protein D6819_00180 [Gammaproteobacteria bacterium]